MTVSMLRVHSPSSPTDFRLRLQAELIERCKRNTNYSLRAFAKALEISPAALSGMINGKRKITEKTKARLGRALGIPPEELTSPPLIPEPGFSSESGRDPIQMTLDHYAVIADWYHYAILELIKVQDFEPNTSWVARCLSLTKSEVNIALERLQRVGLLEILPDGKWLDLSAKDGILTNIHETTTSSASKKLQRQILELSLRALDTVPLEDRNHTSMTMAIRKEDLELASKRIRDFRRALCAELEAQPDPSNVYQLHIGLFPVSSVRKEKSHEDDV